ncbi:2-deoxy-5-keto-D-gluconate 6-phosphate aldolase domain-containing protein [Paramicrobacterium chengjingii]|uniref:DUF2090 domain-containing protein n=1 Tax=Paramicrobacterium chengjingii TaxID=2769067 RepID=A0ABX6YHN2_9MICO|nr:DUF2090 domain-containing protein [Microbacterium chengjingii]QPZ38293.1 DUF2090 domain-containing protein [Microbacterium chengjingii]
MTHDNLLILAADQRPWLTNALFGHTGVATAEQRAVTTEAKHLIFEGLLKATESDAATGAAILVDPELGPGVPERALAHSIPLALPIERAGQRLYETEPENLREYLKAFAPRYSKVLVRYNPADSDDERALQRERLAEASAISRDEGCEFLFELLVPPTDEQLAQVDGDAERYAWELRPELTRQAMAEIAEQVGVDIWKLEHQGDVDSSRQTVELARSHRAECILLGAGGDTDTVNSWLQIAAQAGFVGFAIGRSIWWEAVQQLAAAPTDSDVRARSLDTIAATYAGFVTAFTRAQ